MTLNITSPKGFAATGAHTGVKKIKRDLSLIASTVPATAAGCFTQNIVKAAPVVHDLAVIAGGGKVKGIVVNSGNANACTGPQGLADCRRMAEVYGRLLRVSPEEILVCSTGVIGKPMPMDKITPGIQNAFPLLGSAFADGELAAEGIMTTDTFKKTAAAQVSLGGKTVTLAGMAKGSGMIHPNMATMLAFVTTDAAIERQLLQKALTAAVDISFNMISVDGDTSTNDTILVLANGQAANAPITAENEDYRAFSAALTEVCTKLAVQVARDGEGATKLMEVTVSGAADGENARKIARSVVSSNLVKTALFGADANWGRGLCAMGYSGGEFDPNAVSIRFRGNAGEILWMENGIPVDFDENLASAILSEKDVFVDIGLKEGQGTATAWGCDLTYDYVKINGDYRS